MSAVPVPAVLCTLSRAVASLRLPGAAPNAANDLCIEVIPTVDAMGQALASLIKAVERRLPNAQLEGELVAATNAARAALKQFENGL